MFKSPFKKNKDEDKPLELLMKQLDLRYAQLAIELEKLKSLNKKIDRINEKLKSIDSVIESDGIKLPSQTKSAKTIEAIKLILEKHGEMTALELGKLIKLSRTRCNEYLKEMEDIGVLVSKTISRKKVYGIRQ